MNDRTAFPPPLLTTREVAEYLGVTSDTVLRLWRSGDLPGFRLGTKALRFRRSEVEGWLAGKRLQDWTDRSSPRPLLSLA